jgi:16S rRNA (cytidine1402-2'-O)-methyltransferase
MTGTLYLIPVPLGDESSPELILTADTLLKIRSLKEFIVENEKSARQVLKKMNLPTPLQEIRLHPIGKHVREEEMQDYLDGLKAGQDVGLLSEAGCPGIADPGAEIVRKAQDANIRVVPFIGPSSLVLALMASGMNGQSFLFHGYLPVDPQARRQRIRQLARDANQTGTTQLFIETPFRNEKLVNDVLATLDTTMRFCVACDLTLPSEWIRSTTTAQWKKLPRPDLNKRPAVFLIGI